MKFQVLFVMLLFAGTAIAEEASVKKDAIDDYILASRDFRDSEIAAASDRIREWNDALDNLRRRQPISYKMTKFEIERDLAYDTEELARLRFPTEKIYKPFDFSKMKVGSVGELSKKFEFVPLSIVDNLNSVGHVSWYVSAKTVKPGKAFKRLVWLRGIDTTQMADGTAVPLVGFFQVTGTQSYETVEGGNATAFVFEQLSIEGREQDFTLWHMARVWRDDDGELMDEAVLLDYSRRRVSLVDAEGEVTKLRLSKLSKDDIEFVRSWQKRQLEHRKEN